MTLINKMMQVWRVRLCNSSSVNDTAFHHPKSSPFITIYPCFTLSYLPSPPSLDEEEQAIPNSYVPAWGEMNLSFNVFWISSTCIWGKSTFSKSSFSCTDYLPKKRPQRTIRLEHPYCTPSLVPARCPGGTALDWSPYCTLPYSNQAPRRTAFSCRQRGLKQKLGLYPESSKKYKARRPWQSMSKVCLYEVQTTTYLLEWAFSVPGSPEGKTDKSEPFLVSCDSPRPTIKSAWIVTLVSHAKCP